ncbi:MAG: hypothetical protein ACO1TE_05680 [Prosthecobacter sp.]
MQTLSHPAGFLHRLVSIFGTGPHSHDALSEGSLAALLQPKKNALKHLQAGLIPALDGSFERDAAARSKSLAASVTEQRREQLAKINALLATHAGHVNAEAAVRAQVNAQTKRAEQELEQLWNQHASDVREASINAREAQVQYDAFRRSHGLINSAAATPPLPQQNSLWLRLTLFLSQFLALFAIEMKLNIWSVKDAMDGKNHVQEAAILSAVAVVPLWILGFTAAPLVARCLRHRRWHLKLIGSALLMAALAAALFWMSVSTAIRGIIHERAQQSYQVVTGGHRLPGLASQQAAAKTAQQASGTPLLAAVREVREMQWWLPQIIRGDYFALFFWILYAICLAFAGWKGVVFFGSAYFHYWQMEKRRQDTTATAQRALDQWRLAVRAAVTAFDRELDLLFQQIAASLQAYCTLHEQRGKMVTEHNQHIARLPDILRHEQERYKAVTMTHLKRRGVRSRRHLVRHGSAEDFSSCRLPDHSQDATPQTLESRVLSLHSIIEAGRTRLICLEGALFERMREWCQELDHWWEAEPQVETRQDNTAVQPSAL